MKLTVLKIESIHDLDGNLGKRIDLVEERNALPVTIRPLTEEQKFAQHVFQGVQIVMPQFCPQRVVAIVPKIVLFLTEQEYDSLGVDFNVNQVYEVTLEAQGIKFQKEEETSIDAP